MAIDYTDYVDPAMRRAQAKAQTPEKTVQDVLNEDSYYYQKVGNTGLTQAQIDARENAAAVATKTGGTVNPATGMITPKPAGRPTISGTGPVSKKVVGTYESNGSTYALYDDGSTKLLAQGKTVADTEKSNRLGAYNILLDQFTKYGLGSLVSDVKDFLINGYTAEEIPLALQNTKSYQTRFAANAQRIAKGLSALNPAQYIALEDQYQNIMRNYGLPDSYYAQTTDTSTGVKRRMGFDQLIAGDVSAAELESRVQAAKDRVLNANPEVLQMLKTYYPGITNGDILAYTLDPKNALKDIERKVSAAEIGGAALAAGLTAGVSTAEELAGYGITKQQAQQGYQAVGEMLPRGSQLAAIYNQDPYTQQTAESEVFGTAGSVEAAKKRKKLQSLETSSFSGSSGVGSLGKESSPYRQQTYGAGQY